LYYKLTYHDSTIVGRYLYLTREVIVEINYIQYFFYYSYKQGSNDVGVNYFLRSVKQAVKDFDTLKYYEGWNFNSGNYLFTTDTK